MCSRDGNTALTTALTSGSLLPRRHWDQQLSAHTLKGAC